MQKSWHALLLHLQYFFSNSHSPPPSSPSPPVVLPGVDKIIRKLLHHRLGAWGERAAILPPTAVTWVRLPDLMG